jgi:hypothetical protein
MAQIQLADDLYLEAQRRASDEGFKTVDEFVARLVSQTIHDQSENFDYVFTPERIAELDQISAEVRAGAKTYTWDEVEEQIAKKRSQWLKDRAI